MTSFLSLSQVSRPQLPGGDEEEEEGDDGAPGDEAASEDSEEAAGHALSRWREEAIDWQRTFSVGAVDFELLRSDWNDLRCNVSGNLQLPEAEAVDVVAQYMERLNARHGGCGGGARRWSPRLLGTPGEASSPSRTYHCLGPSDVGSLMPAPPTPSLSFGPGSRNAPERLRLLLHPRSGREALGPSSPSRASLGLPGGTPEEAPGLLTRCPLGPAPGSGVPSLASREALGGSQSCAVP